MASLRDALHANVWEKTAVAAPAVPALEAFRALDAPRLPGRIDDVAEHPFEPRDPREPVAGATCPIRGAQMVDDVGAS